MALNGLNKVGKAIADEGKFHYQYVSKPLKPTPGTGGFIVDMNQTSGSPKYNAFAGTQLAFTPLLGSGNNGIYPGNFLPGSTKHLARLQVVNTTGSTGAAPDFVYLCDYVGFYPLIDCDDVDVQSCDNSLALPRYSDGDGIRIVLIVQAPLISTAPITITYTNSEGVTGRAATFNLIPGASIGVCATGTGTAGGAGQVTPFFPLASGDSGVRAIESFQMGLGAGGFICAALVKPLATIQTYEQSRSSEKVFGIDNQYLPEIKEGAYLNFLIQRSAVAGGNIYSELVFVNS